MREPNIFDEILLVEDNPGDVRLTREMFREAGFDPVFHVVTDGPDAIDFLRQRGEYGDAPRPDAVILDLHLPRMDGDEVIAELDDDEIVDVPVIALSGSSAAGAVKLNEMQGRVTACVEKPIDPDRVSELARSLDDEGLCG